MKPPIDEDVVAWYDIEATESGTMSHLGVVGDRNPETVRQRLHDAFVHLLGPDANEGRREPYPMDAPTFMIRAHVYDADVSFGHGPLAAEGALIRFTLRTLAEAAVADDTLRVPRERVSDT